MIGALPVALTGGLYSRNPATIDLVPRAHRRSATCTSTASTTGAMVGRQPFGGNRRSGVGSQAGGPDYLLQFTEPRVVSENTMRHGLETEAT